MVLEYFGEDTSSLTVRPDCCDNCARGLSTWSCYDLYYGFNRDEKYDFTRVGFMLLNTIKQVEQQKTFTSKERIVQAMRGIDYSRLNQIPYYGQEKINAPYFWVALIDHFKCTEYIQTVPGEKKLTLSNLARQWLEHPRNLIQKPEGATYRFFKRKPNTPMVIL